MKRGFLVGIDHYRENPLSGCCSDARKMASLLSYHENSQNNYECDILTSEGQAVHTQNLRDRLREFLQRNTSEAIIYLSGHASQSVWGTFFKCMDDTDGISLREITGCINSCKIEKIILILDCCFSGDAGNFAFSENEITILRRGVSIFSSSSPKELSVQSNGRGKFTEAFLSALHGGASDILGRVTLYSIQAYICEISISWSQSPIFKTHSGYDANLRQCVPKVHPSDLRHIAKLFKNGDTVYLDKRYEASTEPRDSEKEKDFERLKLYRDAGLINPDGAPSLYEAAIFSKRCTLTGLGMYYRELVRQGNI